MQLWDGTAEQIEPHPEILCQQCDEQPALLIDQAGEYWCQTCLDEARAGLFRLVNDLVQMEQRRQQPEPPLAPAEEAEVTGLNWCILSEDIQTTEATWTQCEL